jgi:hypothetical protein
MIGQSGRLHPGSARTQYGRHAPLFERLRKEATGIKKMLACASAAMLSVCEASVLHIVSGGNSVPNMQRRFVQGFSPSLKTRSLSRTSSSGSVQ